ncbi:hypothetical protein BZA05DRAFT_340175 [Tricharina praecox]|uniref:uncharacterized protein n=1 Tax=Tricharina praecox TaxID=43433 RepID=UPI0022209E09|nr:uncharacterized protein BZA05DRAFT_340175 [Tricharina praecox]KAI5848398.1 hypothetical protein BZA05DRAFT_340175 [Tricharina praecox]
MRKPSQEPSPSSASTSSSESTSPSQKLKKFVRFLDRVEIFPAPVAFYMPSDDQPSSNPAKKQKLSRNSSRRSFHDDDDLGPELDAGIASGLGWAGSPNRSPNRSPNISTADVTTTTSSSTHEKASGYLTPPRTDMHSSPPSSPPPSWRIPPESLFGRQPTVRSPPRVRSPSRADEEVDLRVNEHEPSNGGGDDSSEDEEAVTHPVIARKMWPHGEVRFEDQWGRRLIPLEHRDSFRFDLWPVEEDVDREGDGDGRSVRGAWVKGGRYREAPMGARLFEQR